MRPILKKFSGIEGTKIYKELESTETVYKAFILEKPVSKSIWVHFVDKLNLYQ